MWEAEGFIEGLNAAVDHTEACCDKQTRSVNEKGGEASDNIPVGESYITANKALRRQRINTLACTPPLSCSNKAPEPSLKLKSCIKPMATTI